MEGAEQVLFVLGIVLFLLVLFGGVLAPLILGRILGIGRSERPPEQEEEESGDWSGGEEVPQDGARNRS